MIWILIIFYAVALCTNVQSIDKMNLDGYTEKYKKGAAGTVSPLKVL